MGQAEAKMTHEAGWGGDSGISWTRGDLDGDFSARGLLMGWRGVSKNLRIPAIHVYVDIHTWLRYKGTCRKIVHMHDHQKAMYGHSMSTPTQTCILMGVSLAFATSLGLARVPGYPSLIRSLWVKSWTGNK